MLTRGCVLLLCSVSLAACASSTVILGGRADSGARADGGLDAGVAIDATITDAGSDAPPPDARSLTPFPDGTYTLTISPTSTMILCTGPTLSGHESDFAAITRDTLGLTEGVVTLHGIDATHLDVSGPPIESGFLMPTVTLEPGGGGAPGVPLDVWFGIGTRVGTGPLDTTLLATELEAHEPTITPTGFDGRVSALYVSLAVMDDQCVLAFDAHYSR